MAPRSRARSSAPLERVTPRLATRAGKSGPWRSTGSNAGSSSSSGMSSRRSRRPRAALSAPVAASPPMIRAIPVIVAPSRRVAGDAVTGRTACAQRGGRLAVRRPRRPGSRRRSRRRASRSASSAPAGSAAARRAASRRIAWPAITGPRFVAIRPASRSAAKAAAPRAPRQWRGTRRAGALRWSAAPASQAASAACTSSARLAHTIVGEAGGALERGGRARVAAALEAVASGVLERDRRSLVGAHRRCGQVPRASVELVVRQHRGERAVRLPPRAERGVAVDGRADQRDAGTRRCPAASGPALPPRRASKPSISTSIRRAARLSSCSSPLSLAAASSRHLRASSSSAAARRR